MYVFHYSNRSQRHLITKENKHVCVGGGGGGNLGDFPLGPETHAQFILQIFMCSCEWPGRLS